jgi:FtsZ-binding cell division protein ZapB
MTDKAWNFVNSNIISGLVSGSIVAYIGYWLTKSYRENELKELKIQNTNLSEDYKSIKTRVYELDTANRRLLTESNITQNKLQNFIYDIDHSWCFWKSNLRYQNANSSPKQDNSEESMSRKIS